MIAKISVIVKCEECYEKGDLEEMHFTCTECKPEKEYTPEHIQNCLKEVSEEDHHWTDREHYIGFKSEEEKTIYLRGLYRGYQLALFGVADWFGEVSFFEKLPIWS